jgi:hypothetical protein
MAEKVAKTGVTRDDQNYLYFIKEGGVWRVPRKQPGVQKGKPEKVTDAGIEMDYSYIYFLDKDGDIARSKRAIGGQKRKKKAKKVKKVKKVKKAKKAKKPVKKAKKPVKKAKKPAKKAKKPAKKTAKKKK